MSLRGDPDVNVISPLCASSMGFTLHAATTVSAYDTRAREALAHYVMRPPLAQERLHLLPDISFASSSNERFGTATPTTLRSGCRTRSGDAEEWSKDH